MACYRCPATCVGMQKACHRRCSNVVTRASRLSKRVAYVMPHASGLRRRDTDFAMRMFVFRSLNADVVQLHNYILAISSKALETFS